MNILNFGSANLDYVYKVDHIVLPGETISATDTKIVFGGKGFNQSLALSRAGANVFHAGCIGQGGSALAENLQKEGVNISHIRNVSELQGNAIIQVDKNGQNSIILFGGSNQCLTKEQIDNTLSDESWNQGDFIMIQNEVNELAYIIDKAYEKGMRIVLNPSPYNEAIDKVDLNKISWLLVNEVEAAQMTGLDADVANDYKGLENPVILWADEIWNNLKKKYMGISLVLTLGGKGSVCYSGDEKVFTPAIKVQAVDTTAAGDTFTGYFLAGLAEGLSLDKCMKRASVAAGISVTREGAGPSIPGLEEVLSSMQLES